MAPPSAAQAVEQGELDAAIQAAEDASGQNKAARKKAEELAKASNAAWEKVEALKAKSRDPNAVPPPPPHHTHTHTHTHTHVWGACSICMPVACSLPRWVGG